MVLEVVRLNGLSRKRPKKVVGGVYRGFSRVRAVAALALTLLSNLLQECNASAPDRKGATGFPKDVWTSGVRVDNFEVDTWGLTRPMLASFRTPLLFCSPCILTDHLKNVKNW